MSDQLLKRIEKRLKRLEGAVFGKKSKIGGERKAQPSDTSRFSGATGGVRFLISKGFFKKKQALAHIRVALSENGYHYSKQAVHAALNNLTARGGPLVSLQEEGRKIYVERK